MDVDWDALLLVFEILFTTAIIIICSCKHIFSVRRIALSFIFLFSSTLIIYYTDSSNTIFTMFFGKRTYYVTDTAEGAIFQSINIASIFLLLFLQFFALSKTKLLKIDVKGIIYLSVLFSFFARTFMILFAGLLSALFNAH